MACPDENVIVAFASGQLGSGRIREVGAHIDACPDCSAMAADAALAMGEPPPDPSTDTRQTRGVGSGPEDRPPPGPREIILPRGTSLGRYVVLDLLATGGLGQVYVAYDPELDRRVAIKLLRPSSSPGGGSSDPQRWLMREAQAMAQLSHPNVVPVHDVGTYEREVFIAMELVDGGTLRDWLRAQRRPWKAIRDTLVLAGHGLVAAHEAGLVHRDFKPTNVLIGGDDRVFVVDFGLARAVVGPPPAPSEDPLTLSADPLLQEDLTETGAIIGTPAYMAPEQVRGREVGPAADQFAFCVTLYEALHGERPFVGRSLQELHDAIERGPPTEAARTDAPHPAWLRRALLRGLAAAPDQRFESMPALLEALTVDRRSRRRQWAFLGLAALLSAGAATTVAVAVQPEITATQRDEVATLAEQARAAAARALYIYPPENDPQAPTAYVKVLELEALPGAAHEVGRVQAGALREEFADTLVRLGDSYWAREGGAMFASDYYAAAVMFDPGRARAWGRMLLTPGQLGALSARASDLAFSGPELAAGQALIALAQTDPEARRRGVQAWAQRSDGPVATHTQLERLFGDEVRRNAGVSPRAEPDATGAVAAPGDGVGAQASSVDDAELGPAGEGVGAAADAPEEEADAPSQGGGPGRGPKRNAGASGTSTRGAPTPTASDPTAPADDESSEAPSPRDPEAARTEVASGRAALRELRLDVAAKHFHRALEHDPRSAAAAAGLSEVHFDSGQYSKAVKYAERAVRLAPKNARYRRLAGDAYLNVMRYADARTQYEKAKALGDGLAASRLKLLEKKTGK